MVSSFKGIYQASSSFQFSEQGHNCEVARSLIFSPARKTHNQNICLPSARKFQNSEIILFTDHGVDRDELQRCPRWRRRDGLHHAEVHSAGDGETETAGGDKYRKNYDFLALTLQNITTKPIKLENWHTVVV